jgi:hypothetical protein
MGMVGVRTIQWVTFRFVILLEEILLFAKLSLIFLMEQMLKYAEHRLNVHILHFCGIWIL